MNRNFSSKLNKLNFTATSEEVADTTFKVSIELPSDKLSNVGYDLTTDLKDSNINVIDQELSGNKLILTIQKSDELDKKALREMIKEACYGNDMKRSEFKIIIDE